MSDTPLCQNCGQEITVMAFRDTVYCSVDCRKELGVDNLQLSTMTLLTREETQLIKELRSNGR